MLAFGFHFRDLCLDRRQHGLRRLADVDQEIIAQLLLLRVCARGCGYGFEQIVKFPRQTGGVLSLTRCKPGQQRFFFILRVIDPARNFQSIKECGASIQREGQSGDFVTGI